MKRATYGIQLIKGNRGFAGICLGTSHHLVHEAGIAGLQTELDLPATIALENAGIPGRTIRRSSPCIRLLRDTDRGFTYLALLPEKILPGLSATQLDTWMDIGGDRPLHTAWSDCAFAIRGTTKEYGELLTALATGLHQKRVLVYVDNGEILSAGLCLVKSSDVTKRLRENLVKHDYDQVTLKERLATSGLTERLVAAGFGHYLVTPHFFKPGEQPVKNSRYNFCVTFYRRGTSSPRCTVEEIDQWLEEQTTLKRSA